MTAPDDDPRFLWTFTARRKAREMGIPMREVDDAVTAPSMTHADRRTPSLERRYRGRVCALVDPRSGVLVTFFLRDDV